MGHQWTRNLPGSLVLLLAATALCHCGQGSRDEQVRLAQAGTSGVGAASIGGSSAGGGGGQGGASASGAAATGGAAANGGGVMGGAGSLEVDGGEGGASAEGGKAGESGVKLPADFCPETPPVSSTTCGLNYNHPDAVCVYGEQTCRCFSPNLMYAPPLWNCT